MLIAAELNSKGGNCSFRRYNNLCNRFGTWKVWRPESKLFQRRPKVEFPGRAGREERLSRSKLKQAFLIDSDAKLFVLNSIYQVRLMKSSAPEPCLTDASLVRFKRTHADENRKQCQHPSAIPFTRFCFLFPMLCDFHISFAFLIGSWPSKQGKPDRLGS